MTMEAMALHQHGDRFELRVTQLDIPEPGPDDVLIKVKATSMNHLDLWVRNGIPGLKLPMPHVLGADVAGVIAEIGANVEAAKEDWTEGDRVVIDPGLSCGYCPMCLKGEHSLCDSFRLVGEHVWGGNAQYCKVPAVNLHRLPTSWEWTEAAAIPLVSLTAYRMAVGRADLRPGETVLVMGATGGVGTMAVQIASQLGASVIATAGTDEKATELKALGAHEVINYRSADIAEEVKGITNGRGVDVVLDSVGQAVWKASMKALARGGRFVTCGATTGFEAKLNLTFLFWNQYRIMGSTMGSHRETAEALALAWAGKIRPVIDRVLPLAELQEAHRVVEEGEMVGKVVLRVD